MTSLITAGSETIAPQQILNITTEQDSGNIIHQILGRAGPDVTLRPAGLRTGTLEMGFVGPTSEQDSEEARTIHATAGVLSLSSTDRATVEMTYVVSGRITRELESESRDAWIVTVAYQEVTE